MAISLIAARASDAGPRCGVTTIIAIDGPAGSGKTTLAGKLSTHLGAQLLHMDDLYNGWDGLREGGQTITHLLQQISRGEAATYRRYDWDEGRYLEKHTLDPGGVIVVEGVGSVRLEHLDMLSLVVVVQEPDADERLRRGLERDGAYLEELWKQWMVEEAELHREVNLLARADVVVNGHGTIVRS